MCCYLNVHFQGQRVKFAITSAINSTGKRSHADCMDRTALGPICSFGPLVAGTDICHWEHREAFSQTHRDCPGRNVFITETRARSFPHRTQLHISPTLQLHSLHNMTIHKLENFVIKISCYFYFILFYFFGCTSALRSLRIAPTRPVICKETLSVCFKLPMFTATEQS